MTAYSTESETVDQPVARKHHRPDRRRHSEWNLHTLRDPKNHVLADLTTVGASSLRDTLTSLPHSKDFTYARADYLRSRVWVIGLIFLALMPLWIAVDFLQLPESALQYAIPGRIAMGLVLIAMLVLTRRNHTSVLLARLSAGVLLGMPAAFYTLVLLVMPAGGEHSLIGYSFIPYMLIAMLSVFPFTLLESAVAGMGMLLLQLLSQQVTGSWWTAAGLQESWLLAALLVITLTANYFHLGLLLRLYREATHDPLTGLLNRGALIRNMEQFVHLRPRPDLSLLMIDLDHFKQVNDTYGHSIGDVVLRDFAKELRQAVRQDDIVARYGGEEFVVVLFNADKDGAMQVGEKIRRQAESMEIKTHDNDILRFTVSIGVAHFRPDDTLESVARRADERLYKAKQKSRNYVVGV